MQLKYAHFEKETRYYTLILEQDLLADWIVVRRFGRKNTTLGRHLKEVCTTYKEALKKFNHLVKYRERKRKYDVVSS